MSIDCASNLANAFKNDPFLEIHWKYEKEIDIDALKLRYKIPLTAERFDCLRCSNEYVASNLEILAFVR